MQCCIIFASSGLQVCHVITWEMSSSPITKGLMRLNTTEYDSIVKYIEHRLNTSAVSGNKNIDRDYKNRCFVNSVNWSGLIPTLFECIVICQYQTTSTNLSYTYQCLMERLAIYIWKFLSSMFDRGGGRGAVLAVRPIEKQQHITAVRLTTSTFVYPLVLHHRCFSDIWYGCIVRGRSSTVNTRS